MAKGYNGVIDDYVVEGIIASPDFDSMVSVIESSPCDKADFLLNRIDYKLSKMKGSNMITRLQNNRRGYLRESATIKGEGIETTASTRFSEIYITSDDPNLEDDFYVVVDFNSAVLARLGQVEGDNAVYSNVFRTVEQAVMELKRVAKALDKEETDNFNDLRDYIQEITDPNSPYTSDAIRDYAPYGEEEI